MLATDDQLDVAPLTLRELRELHIQLAEAGVPVTHAAPGPLMPAEDIAAWHDHGLFVRADAALIDKLWALRVVASHLRHNGHRVRHLRLVPGGA